MKCPRKVRHLLGAFLFPATSQILIDNGYCIQLFLFGIYKLQLDANASLASLKLPDNRLRQITSLKSIFILNTSLGWGYGKVIFS